MSADLGTLARRSPSRPRRESRRASLLAALEDQLQRHTLADVSISAVARSAGLGRSAFYFYFPSKYAAVAELLVDVYEELVGLGRDLVTGVGSPRDTVAAALGHTVMTWRRHRLLFCAMLEAAAADPEVRIVWDGWVQMFEDLLVQAAREQLWSIDLPAGVDLRSTVRALLDMNQRVLERFIRSGADAAAAPEVTLLIAHMWTSTIFGRRSDG